MRKVKKNGAFDFEKALIELEEIVEQIEQGKTTLEVSLEQFARAVLLLKGCQTTLKVAEQKVQILLNKGQGDGDSLVPFEIDEKTVL